MEHLEVLEMINNGSHEDIDWNKPFPCLLFLDALRMHNMSVVGNNVRKWLNAEWKRLKPHDCENEAPFKTKTMRIYSPNVPRQMNDFDCGVFVCRYAYGLIRIRSRMFSYKEAGFDGGDLFKAMITTDEAFQFDMDDIDRIRGEMKILIERLSEVYLPWHAEQVRKLKEERKARKLAKQKKAADEHKENAEANINGVQAASADPPVPQKPASSPTSNAASNSSSEPNSTVY